MNKKYIIITISILILIIISSLIFLLRNKEEVYKNTSDTLKDTEKSITLLNSSIIAMAYTDSIDKNDQVNIAITIYNNMYSNKDIKNAQIKNIKLESKSNILKNYNILPPTDIERTTNMNFYYQPIDNNSDINTIKFSNSNNIKYVINTKTDSMTLKTNEINTTNGTMEFKIFIPNIGKYNYEEILKNNNVFESSKLLQYANITNEDLNSKISYTLYIETNDNIKHIQNIYFDIQGEKLVESGIYNKDDFNNIKF